MRLSDNTRGVLYMCISMFAFTLNDTFMKAAMDDLPLFQAIALRGVLSSIGLVVIALVTTRSLRLIPSGRDLQMLSLRTLADVGATVLFLGALVHMPLANLSAIIQFLPLAVTLMSALILGDKIGWRRMLAILTGFIGVMMIIRPGAAQFDIWSVMGLGSVVCVVVRDLSTRQFSSAMPSSIAAVWAALAVTVMGLVGALAQGWRPVGFDTTLLLLGAAFFLIVGYMYAIMVMRIGEIGITAPFRYTSLLWAIVLGWMLFGTLPDLMASLGSAVVVASGIYMLLRERKLRLLAATRG